MRMSESSIGGKLVILEGGSSHPLTKSPTLAARSSNVEDIDTEKESSSPNHKGKKKSSFSENITEKENKRRSTKKVSLTIILI